MEAAARVSAAAVSRHRPATAISNPAVTATVSNSDSAAESTAVEARAIAAESISIAAAEPGAGADEQTADEVVRPLITVGRAGVGVIPVVAILTSRSRVDRIRSGIPNSHRNLSLSGLDAHRKKQNQNKAE
jgi:hypothetical protein